MFPLEACCVGVVPVFFGFYTRKWPVAMVASSVAAIKNIIGLGAHGAVPGVAQPGTGEQGSATALWRIHTERLGDDLIFFDRHNRQKRIEILCFRGPLRMLEDTKKTLWATADRLRANMDAAEYKHLALG